MYHAVRPFVQTVLLANVHIVMCCWSGPRLLASGTLSKLDPHSLKLLSGILQLP